MPKLALFVFLSFLTFSTLPLSYPIQELDQDSGNVRTGLLKGLQNLPIFKKVPEDGAEEFFDIYLDLDKPRGQVDVLLDLWAKKYAVQEDWAIFKTNYDYSKFVFNRDIFQLLETLPGDFDELAQILESQQFSLEEKLGFGDAILEEVLRRVEDISDQFHGAVYGISDANVSGDNSL